MKTIILKISIVPLLVLTIIAFANFQPGNGKGNKGNKEQGQSRGNNSGEDKKQEKDRENYDKHQPGAGQSDEKHGNGKDNKEDRKESHASAKPHGAGKSDDDHQGNGKIHREAINWISDNYNGIDWNLANFPNRKHPKDQKKVTICHQTGSSFPVNINVSENALQAHLKHGDQVGNCNVNFGSWPQNYIRSRETVYNSYENTWENMSYSEALLKIAMDKLLGIKTDLNQNRSRLSAQEIQRRELLIMDLQNNANSLDNQIGVTRQALNGININIQL